MSVGDHCILSGKFKSILEEYDGTILYFILMNTRIKIFKFRITHEKKKKKKHSVLQRIFLNTKYNLMDEK